jgi:hypothetical protein
MAAAGRAVTAFVRDPAGSVRRAVDSAGNALGAVANGLVNAGKGALDRVSTAWDTGNFRELGRMTGRVVGEVALSVEPVGGIASKLGLAGRLASGATQVATGVSRLARPVAAIAGRAGPALNKALTASRNLVGAAKSRLNTVVRRGPLEGDSCTLVLRCRADFSPSEVRAMAHKARDLNAAARRGELVVTRVTSKSRSSTSAFRRANRLVDKDWDHVIELQLGGRDVISNLRRIPSSVNRSAGAQIARQLRNVPAGTRIRQVRLERMERTLGF